MKIIEICIEVIKAYWSTKLSLFFQQVVSKDNPYE